MVFISFKNCTSKKKSCTAIKLLNHTEQTKKILMMLNLRTQYTQCYSILYSCMLVGSVLSTYWSSSVERSTSLLPTPNFLKSRSHTKYTHMYIISLTHTYAHTHNTLPTPSNRPHVRRSCSVLYSFPRLYVSHYYCKHFLQNTNEICGG